MAIEDAAVVASMLGQYIDDPADALRAMKAPPHRTIRAQKASARQARSTQEWRGTGAQPRHEGDGRRKTARTYDWLYTWKPPELAASNPRHRLASDLIERIMLFPNDHRGSLPKPSCSPADKLWPRSAAAGDDLRASKLDPPCSLSISQEDAASTSSATANSRASISSRF